MNRDDLVSELTRLELANGRKCRESRTLKIQELKEQLGMDMCATSNSTGPAPTRPSPLQTPCKSSTPRSSPSVPRKSPSSHNKSPSKRMVRSSMKTGVEYANSVAKMASIDTKLVLILPGLSNDKTRNAARALLAFNFPRQSVIEEIDERIADPDQVTVAMEELQSKDVIGAFIAVRKDDRFEIHFFCTSRQGYGYGAIMFELMAAVALKMETDLMISHSLTTAAKFWRRMGFEDWCDEEGDRSEYVDTMLLSRGVDVEESALVVSLRASMARVNSKILKWKEQVHEHMSALPRYSYDGFKAALQENADKSGTTLLSPVGIEVARRMSPEQAGGSPGKKRWQHGSIVEYWADVSEYVVEWGAPPGESGESTRQVTCDLRVLEVLVNAHYSSQ